MRSFAARYRGTCGACFEPIDIGDEVGYSSEGVLVDMECLAAGAIASPVHPRGDEAPDIEATTLPRGRTIADRCDGCFQVPASSGSCGCE